MEGSTIGSQILCKIPEKFQDAVKAGRLERVGMTIVKSSSRKIAGHLQETGAIPQVPVPTNPVSLIGQGAQLASSVGQNIQLEQVKGMLSTLKMMNAVTMGASLAGVGVSVAGFAMVNRKLESLSDQLSGVAKQLSDVHRTVNILNKSRLVRERSKLEALLYSAEEAWTRSNPEESWSRVESTLLEEEMYYRKLICGFGTQVSVFVDSDLPLAQAIAIYEANQLLASTRLKTLLLLDEKQAALKYGKTIASYQDEALADISPTDVVDAKLDVESELRANRKDEVRISLTREVEPFLNSVREIELTAAQRPGLIEKLISRDVNGKEYVQRLREESEQPLLLMPE